jgi:hypothetical protein
VRAPEDFVICGARVRRLDAGYRNVLQASLLPFHYSLTNACPRGPHREVQAGTGSRLFTTMIYISFVWGRSLPCPRASSIPPSASRSLRVSGVQERVQPNPVTCGAEDAHQSKSGVASSDKQMVIIYLPEVGVETEFFPLPFFLSCPTRCCLKYCSTV